MTAHRLWAGVALLIAATALQTAYGGSWALMVLVAFGVLLTLSSFTREHAQ